MFATAGYEASVNNLAMVDLATDNVFSDGSSQQVAAVTGSGRGVRGDADGCGVGVASSSASKNLLKKTRGVL